MRIPDSTINEISDKASIVELVSEYAQVVRKGGKFWACCPFPDHNENTPSFSITEEKNMYYCFGCHKGGSVFNFIMEMESMNFVDAVKHLAEKTGVKIELQDSSENKAQATHRDQMIQLYERCCGSFSYILNELPANQRIKDYLYNRGINQQIIEEFRIGYVPNGMNWLYNFLKSKNYSDQFLKTSGFFSKRNSTISIFFDRVMFPVINHNGQVVAFSGRALTDNGPKYINSPETDIYHKGSILFGINLAIKEIRQSKSFILCEGNLDVMALHQAGLKNAVAPLGTAFTEPQAKLLKRYAERGVILFDGDAAGIKATEKACGILERVGITPQVVSIPDGMDPAEILKKNGPEALINYCKYTINSFDYLLERLVMQFGSESPESKERVAKGMLPYINSINSDVRKEACLQKLASELGVSVNSIFNDFLNNRKTNYRKREVKKEVPDIYNDKELYLMCALTVNSDYIADVKPFVEEFGITSSHAVLIYNAISTAFEENNASLESILRRIENEELRQLIISKSTSNEFDDNPGKIIYDSLLFLKKKALLNSIALLEDEISVENDIIKISALLKKKSELDEKLGRIEDY